MVLKMNLLQPAFQLMTIFFLTSNFVAGLTLSYKCKDDKDCIQENTYCYSSGECVACTDCEETYNRQPGFGCAKNKNQCGKCRAGMDTEINLDGSITCYPSGTVSPNAEKPGYEAIMNGNTIIAIAVSVVVLGCCAIYWLSKGKCTCVLVRSILTICPVNLMNTGNYRPPPPYTEKAPSAPPFEDSIRTPPGSPIFETVSPIFENDTSQTANPYNNPQYVGGGTLGPNPYQDQQEDEEEESANETLINSTILQPTDEETQPSSWTPSPSHNSETGSTGPTTFSNVLNFQQLSISQPDVTTVATIQLPQGASGRLNSQPNIQFTNAQFNTGNSENLNTNNNIQQINFISHVDTVILNSTISQ